MFERIAQRPETQVVRPPRPIRNGYISPAAVTAAGSFMWGEFLFSMVREKGLMTAEEADSILANAQNRCQNAAIGGEATLIGYIRAELAWDLRYRTEPAASAPAKPEGD